MSSAIFFNLDHSKLLLSGNGLSGTRKYEIIPQGVERNSEKWAKYLLCWGQDCLVRFLCY